MRNIITINREYGSGGREVGRLLSKKLNIPLYDKELITRISEGGEFSKEILQELDEKQVYHSASHYGPKKLLAFYQQPLPDKIFLEQYKLIKELAGKGPCIIIGRCSDYILKEEGFHFFIHANLQSRIERKYRIDGEESRADVRKRVIAVDRQRKKYYEYHTDRKWKDPGHYHLCIDTSKISLEFCADMIFYYIKQLK